MAVVVVGLGLQCRAGILIPCGTWTVALPPDPLGAAGIMICGGFAVTVKEVEAMRRLPALSMDITSNIWTPSGSVAIVAPLGTALPSSVAEDVATPEPSSVAE